MNAFNRIRGIRLEERWVPWVLLGAVVLAYGVMIRSLGFYWDDWEILYLSTAAETPADIFLFSFRPLHVYLDILTVRLLGYSPLPWHLLLLVVRYLGGLVFWLLLKELWPDRPARNAWVALLFLVYPAFLQQPISVAYRQHFTSALVYLLSVWLMARAYNLRRRGEFKRFWLMFALSLLSGVAHLYIMEYFAALELWRPLILGLLIWRDEPDWRERLAKLMFFWLPYLLYTAGYVVWRLAYVQNQIDDPNQTVLLDNLRAAPLRTALLFFQNAFLDLGHLLLNSWVDIFNADLLNFSSPVSLLVLVLAAAAGLAAFWLLGSLTPKTRPDPEGEKFSGALLLGFSSLALGLVPVWMIGRNVFEGHYDTRFSIPSLAGASLVVVAVACNFIPSRKKGAALLAVLFAFGVGRQVHMTNTFRWDWERQTRTYWQIFWRAPEIEPQTAVLVNKSVSSYATTYPVAYALNFIYAPENISMSPDYWWFEIYESKLHTRTDELAEGAPVWKNFHNLSFSVPGSQALVFNLPAADEPTRCVWLLTGADRDSAKISPEMQQMASLTNLSRLNPDVADLPPAEIFGTEPSPTWCYYYQKADLAAQLEDWETVNQLYVLTRQHELSSNYGHEYLPFLAGSIAVQAWEQAADQTLIAYKSTPSLRPDLCVAWEKLEANPVELPSYNHALDRVNEMLGCVSQ